MDPDQVTTNSDDLENAIHLMADSEEVKVVA